MQGMMVGSAFIVSRPSCTALRVKECLFLLVKAIEAKTIARFPCFLLSLRTLLPLHCRPLCYNNPEAIRHSEAKDSPGDFMLRQPAVAGYFYQGTSSRLRDQVEHFLVPGKTRVRARGIISPHAGLVYSGAVAGAVYSRIVIPETAILIGPNHTGLGAPVSIMAEGRWMTPLGQVPVDEGLASSIRSRSRRVQDDSLAHLREHSLEVQLPFLQHLRDDVRIVPIQMLDTRLETCTDLGNAVAGAVSEREAGSEGDASRVLIVASTDMSHYISAKEAKERDRHALDRILALDPEGLFTVVRDEHITMCGYGPVVAMLKACKALGASRAELIKYANSGEVSGDYEQVVGYAGVVVY